MKKLISGISALAIAVAIAPMSAFADTTNVTFNAPRNSPEYIITIPPTADLNAENPKATIKAENVYLDTTKHKQINVTLDSADYVSKGDSTFIAKTKDGNSQVTYTIGKGTATTGVKVGDTVAEFTAGGSVTLNFSAPTGATYAGTHSEVLTFGISVENAVNVTSVRILNNGSEVNYFQALTLSPGDTLTLTAETDPEGATVTWSSSDPSIATVDQNGVVRGVGVADNVKITATAGRQTATCRLTVMS